MATYQEFYADAAGASGASNMNAGDKLTSPTTTTNGAYTQGGGSGGGTKDLFVATGGTPFSGVSVGDYVSIYADGATTPAFIGYISAKNSNTSIDIDSTKSSGTRPTTGATGKTATVGGRWLGPTGAVSHPIGFITAASVDASGNTPRVNFLNGSSYSITAAMTHGLAGPVRFEGATATPADGGRWVIDGGTSGASYGLLTITGANCDLVGLTAQNNGASGSAAGITVSGAEFYFKRVVVHDVRGHGFNLSINGDLVECEAYACNQSNSAGTAGYNAVSTASFIRCIAHDNTGSNTSGFVLAGNAFCLGCIADTNGLVGFNLTSTSNNLMVGCDAYNNTSDGFRLANTSAASFYLESCNAVKNGGWGINGSGAGGRNGAVISCGFGSGTQANSSGTTTGLKSMGETGSVTYASGVTPWVDPANGDFRINLAAAKGAGRGTFLQTAASYAGTVGYPDIGAAQHLDVGGVFGSVRRVAHRVAYPRKCGIFLPLPIAPASPVRIPARRIVWRMPYPLKRTLFVPAPVAPASPVATPARRILSRMFYPHQRTLFVPAPVAAVPLPLPPRRIWSRHVYPVPRPACPALFLVQQTILVTHRQTVR
jgi:hypothetical protein